MNTRYPKMLTGYWMLRGVVLTFAGGALLLLIGGLLIGLSYGKSEPGDILYLTAGFIVLICYLIPNRWGVTTAFFHFRFTIELLAVARLFYMTILLVSGIYGQKHFLIYPVLGVALLATSTAPVLLVVRRRAHMKTLKASEPANA